MKNKKGFTLIELLAIIVILAIIAVITVPIILNIIDNSKMGAATDSAHGYKDAIDKFYVAKLSIDPGYNIQDNTYTKQDFDNMGLAYSGKSPANNSFLRIQNNKVIQGCLQFDEYKVMILDGKIQNAVKGQCKIKLIEYTDSDNSETINLGDYVEIGEDGFYVIGTEETNVKLLAQYNLDSNSRQSSDNTITVRFAETNYWWDTPNSTFQTSTFSADAQGKYYAYRTSAGAETDNNLKEYINNYKEYLKGQGASSVIDVKLMSYAEAYSTGCRTTGSCPTYISNQTYWLGSARSYSNVWGINSSGNKLGSPATGGAWGIRPLVIINESALQTN